MIKYQSVSGDANRSIDRSIVVAFVVDEVVFEWHTIRKFNSHFRSAARQRVNERTANHSGQISNSIPFDSIRMQRQSTAVALTTAVAAAAKFTESSWSVGCSIADHLGFLGYNLSTRRRHRQVFYPSA